MAIKKIILVGARLDGHAGVVLDTISNIGGYHVVGFIDNSPNIEGKFLADIPVLGSTDDIQDMEIPADCIHIAIGENIARGRLCKILLGRGIVVESIIHPSSFVSGKATIDSGCFVGAGAAINNGVRIGSAVIVNTGAVVEHDNVIGHAAHLA
ncbi:MAG: hypothetical protein P8N92_03510, partial [Burkholderiales bacterium]|nr:hypothetical protein [Burkholderiales bacterium]